MNKTIHEQKILNKFKNIIIFLQFSVVCIVLYLMYFEELIKE